MPDVVFGDLSRQGRARADQAHLAPKHVPELRQLVQRRSPQETADPRDPGVVGEFEGMTVDLVLRDEVRQLLLGVGAHAAELDNREQPSVKAHSLLPEEDGALRVELDRHGQHQYHG
jgi:hypothetical protein